MTRSQKGFKDWKRPSIDEASDKQRRPDASQEAWLEVARNYAPAVGSGPSRRKNAQPSNGEATKQNRAWLRKFDHFQLNALLLGRFGRHLASIASIDEGQLHHLARDVLDGLSQFASLRPILRVGRSDQQSQHVAARINGGMHVAACAALGSIIADMTATFCRRLQGAAIEGGCAGLFRL